MGTPPAVMPTPLSIVGTWWPPPSAAESTQCERGESIAGLEIEHSGEEAEDFIVERIIPICQNFRRTP